jgi:aminoglycoside phosphotransferase
MKNRLEKFDDSTNDLKTAEQIVLEFLGNQTKFTIRYLGEGSNNIVYLVEGESKIVVKLSKPDFEYKALSDYQKEEWCTAKAHGLNIPSPKVLKLGVHDFRAFIIESYIEGSPIAHLDESSTFSEEEKTKAWGKLGEYTKKINSVQVIGR